MSTRNISLTEYYDQFVADAVDSGRYKNASEVVRAGLRLLEDAESEQAEKLQTLKNITQASFEAMDRGEFSARSFDEITDTLDIDLKWKEEVLSRKKAFDEGKIPADSMENVFSRLAQR